MPATRQKSFPKSLTNSHQEERSNPSRFKPAGNPQASCRVCQERLAGPSSSGAPGTQQATSPETPCHCLVAPVRRCVVADRASTTAEQLPLDSYVPSPSLFGEEDRKFVTSWFPSPSGKAIARGRLFPRVNSVSPGQFVSAALDCRWLLARRLSSNARRRWRAPRRRPFVFPRHRGSSGDNLHPSRPTSGSRRLGE